MIGGVALREAPEKLFVLPVNGSNSSLVLNEEALNARRVQVAVVLTTMVGIIQVSLAETVRKELISRERGRAFVKVSHAQYVYPKQQAESFWMYHLDLCVYLKTELFTLHL
ncbi:hypothetical protein CHARACLAT_025709 [Characodon lateralis]|uniref:Uncharacterized protein n=1 Tax=Characodon lateralis TaxID=208331 RepID=A0ABU7EWS0_9TELE|nr:hypothetical protein [Characodon lateralis]